MDHLWWIILATYSILKNFMSLARLFEHVLQEYLQAILPNLQSCTCHVMTPPREHWVWKSQNHSPGPTLPLSQLGHCLRPPNGREAPEFWISRVGRKKNSLRWILKKNWHILITKEQKFWYILLNIGTTKNSLV